MLLRYPRGLALKMKAHRLFPSDKFIGGFFHAQDKSMHQGVFVEVMVWKWKTLLTNLFIIDPNCTALSVYHMTHENHSGSLLYMWHLSNQPILITYVLNNPLISNWSCPLKCTEFLKQMENWKKQQIHW